MGRFCILILCKEIEVHKQKEKRPAHVVPQICSWLGTSPSPSAAGLLLLAARLGDEESFEEEELQVAGGDDEEAERRRPPGDVLRVGQQQEVVGALAHAADAVVAEHVEDVHLHSVTHILQKYYK